MSGPLPDDPARWPDDPHELLGVPPDVGPRDLRRAYTKLIRTYKPEQYPEQFRRLRAAYEAALRTAEFFAAREGDAAGVSADDDSLSRRRQDESPPEPLPPPRPFDPADDPNALWELAAAGHEARAYAALADLAGRRPDQADVSLRLYWLLALDPDLDPGRDPCSWLADAVRLSELAGPAAELFRRELDERPAVALAIGEPLLALDVPTERLAGYASARVAAAGQIGQWDTVRAALDVGRERVRPTDEVSWLRLVLTAIDHLAWAAGTTDAADELLAECRREVGTLEHLAVRYAEQFDRLEFLLTASAGWGALRQSGAVPADLLDLLPLAWVRPYPEVRPRLAALLGQIAASPQNWLRHLDAVGDKNPHALAFFGNLLGQYEQRLAEPTPVPHAPADLARLVAELLRDAGRWLYPEFRPRLLAFCLREGVGVELAAMVAPADEPAGQALRQAVPNDWPLRLVCWACRLFWA